METVDTDAQMVANSITFLTFDNNMSVNLQSIKQRFGIVGGSKLLEAALGTAIRVAPTNLSVLITGESGVGKEAFSKIIHSLSPRKHNDFIAINCGAIPEGTINSELFGHEKGAFTNASGERKGYFETVDGGTIFLDEIGEMPLDTQTSLLRVLENGEFIRVGSSKVLKTDVRVLAATNVNLEDLISKGRFREDLYYRLSTVPIKVPSLRERAEDIYILFRKFSLDFSEKYRTPVITLDERARLVIENYSWPGNIRELRNVAENLSVLAENRQIDAEILLDHMPNLMRRNLPAKTRQFGASNGSSEHMQERDILFKLLFDMKADLNDLKALVFELISSNNLNVNYSQLKQLQSAPNTAASNFGEQLSNLAPSQPLQPRVSFEQEYQELRRNIRHEEEPDDQEIVLRPIIIDTSKQTTESEVVDSSLSLGDMEKNMILKAIKKHGGRRKEAADDLGISERTLYRKIKEYDL